METECPPGMPLRHVCLDRWRKIQILKDWTPPPPPDNPAPQPLPDPPVDVPPYYPPGITDNGPPTAPYTPVNQSGIDTSLILAGVAATIVGVNNQLYPNGSNGYYPGTANPPPVVTPPVSLPVYEEIFNFPVEPLPIFDEPVVIADQWSRGNDVRVTSQPQYVYSSPTSNGGSTTVADLLSVDYNDNHTGPLPFF